jgi:hypothetical protein
MAYLTEVTRERSSYVFVCTSVCALQLTPGSPFSNPWPDADDVSHHRKENPMQRRYLGYDDMMRF